MRRKRERKTRSSVYIPLEVSWRKPQNPKTPKPLEKSTIEEVNNLNS